MKKLLEIFPFFLGIMAIAFGISFIVTLGRYVAEKPVAEVELIKVCQGEGENSYWDGYFAGDQFADVKILRVTDSEKFCRTASQISDDGQRANVDFSTNLEVGKVYKCYDRDSLRGGGLSSWWSNFGDNLVRTFKFVAYGILFLCVGLIFLLVVTTKKK